MAEENQETQDTKQIKISVHVYEQLKEKRDNEGHTSFDSTVRSLLFENKLDS